MKIGEKKTTVCSVCEKPIEWILRQRLVGPEGMRDAVAIWSAPEHGVDEISAEQVTEDGIELCPPQNEPVREPVDGVFTEEQRQKVLSGRDYAPTADPVYVSSEEIAWSDPNISCIMPTTAKRIPFLGRAIRCWLKQSYLLRDLVIVSDGPGYADIAAAIAEPLREWTYLPVPDDLGVIYQGAHTIRHIHLPDDPTRLLGEKYNSCIEYANGPFIACWADDDWHHPQRLEAVLRAMQRGRTPTGGTNAMLCYRQKDSQAFLYWAPQIRPTLISGTMLFTKEHWEACGRFPRKQRASDSAFVAKLLGDLGLPWTTIEEPRLYCAFLHGDNTGNPLNEPERSKEEQLISFTALEGEEANMKRHLGEDAAAFGF